MNAIVDRRSEVAVLIRTVEQTLLRLFAEGKATGTTHTCLKRELSG